MGPAAVLLVALVADDGTSLRSAPDDWPLRRETQGLLEIARRQSGGR